MQALPQSPASLSGTRIKRYEIVAPLGAGGTAELLLARATGAFGFTKLFAIKRIRPGLAQDRERVSQILNEARLASTLQHTNIVQVFDAEADGETVFLVMEYLHGRDVRAILERASADGRKGLPLEHAIGIAISVCAGLHYAHEQVDGGGRPLDIVHRDVSPHNVIVTYDGGVKVIDFGIAEAKSLVEHQVYGKVKGKLGYMSPEQCRGESLDRRSDVFGIGILLYEMTTGRMPFEAPSADRFFDSVLGSPVVPPSSFQDYPVELERIVLRALARDRNDRYPTAREMHRDLEAFARRSQIHTSQLSFAEYMGALFPEDSAAFQQAKDDSESLVGYVIAQTGLSRRASYGDDATTLLHARASLEDAAPTSTAPDGSSSRSALTVPTIPNPRDPGARSRWALAAGLVAVVLVLSGVGFRRMAHPPAASATPSAMTASQPTPLSAREVKSAEVAAPSQATTLPSTPPSPPSDKPPSRSKPKSSPSRPKPTAPAAAHPVDLDAPLPR